MNVPNNYRFGHKIRKIFNGSSATSSNAHAWFCGVLVSHALCVLIG